MKQTAVVGERAGWRWVGRFCQACEAEIGEDDQVIVTEDGEQDADGWRDLSTVQHAGECPPEE